MFEARLNDAEVLRKIIDAMKDLVSEANLDVSPDGVSLQVSQARGAIQTLRLGYRANWRMLLVGMGYYTSNKFNLYVARCGV